MGEKVGIPFGSVVMLKSGGAPMLVVGMSPGQTVVSCEWRDHAGKVHLTVLPAECLVVKKLPNRKMPHERNRT